MPLPVLPLVGLGVMKLNKDRRIEGLLAVNRPLNVAA
jgi:hypothetical protein